jgi:hypothetical protein
MNDQLPPPPLSYWVRRSRYLLPGLTSPEAAPLAQSLGQFWDKSWLLPSPFAGAQTQSPSALPPSRSLLDSWNPSSLLGLLRPIGADAGFSPRSVEDDSIARANGSLLPYFNRGEGVADKELTSAETGIGTAENQDWRRDQSAFGIPGPESGNDARVLSDIAPENNWIPGAQYAGDGHHHVPRAVYRKLPVPAETKKVFEGATTGPLPLYRWHEYDALHRAYNDAVEEVINRFMQEQNIKPHQMTPDQARSVLGAVAESEEPRIRAYREMLKRMWMFYRLRTGGRGNE